MAGRQVTACGWKGHRVTVYLAVYVTVTGPPDRGVCSHHSANSSNLAEAGSMVKAGAGCKRAGNVSQESLYRAGPQQQQDSSPSASLALGTECCSLI